MANETILIVDEDEKIQKVLEVSLKKAGYRILVCDSPKEALDLVQNETPDLIISETGFNKGDGFDFLAKLKAGEYKNTPFLFLTDERALPQKMKGFELGADDYLTKPFYLKEITTRADLLIQRTEDIITQDNENEFSGKLSNVSVVDLLQKLEAEKSSGSIQIQRNEHNASIYFKNGNIFDAFCGKLSGEDAIYRLFFWPEGEFIVRYYDIGKRKDRIPKNCSELLIDGMDKLSRYQEISSKIKLNYIYDVDFEIVAKVRSQLPTSVAEIFRLFNGQRSVRDVIDSSNIDDVMAIQVVKRVIDEGLVIQTSHGNADAEKPNLASWLEDKDAFNGVSSLSEETSLTFQVLEETKSQLDESENERPSRKTERIIESQSRRTTDQQHTIKSEPLTAIEKIENQEAKRRAIEAQHLSGQHQAVTKVDIEESKPKRKRRQTPIRSQAHVSATDLEIELSEIEEDEATTAEIPNAAEAYASMQQAHLGIHVSEADTFEDSEPIDDEFETAPSESSTLDIDDSSEVEAVPSTERATKEIERAPVSDPEISDVEEVEEDEIAEQEVTEQEVSEEDDFAKNHTPFYSDAIVESEDEILPLVERNAIDGEMVSASFEIGKTSKKDPENIADAPKKESVESFSKDEEAFFKKDKDEVATDELSNDAGSMNAFFNSEPDEALAEEAPTPNYWIPALIIGGLIVLGFVFIGGKKKTTPEKPKEVVEKKIEVELPKEVPKVEVDPKLAEAKLAVDEAQLSGTGGATNIEENALTLSLHLSENQDQVETEAEKLEREKAEKEQLDADEKAKAETEKLEAAKQKELANNTKKEEPKAKEEPKEKVEKVEKPDSEKTDASLKKRLKAASTLVKKRKWSKALVALRKLSSEKPGGAKIAYLHGRAAFGARSNSEAIKQFSRAKKLGYKSATMMLDLAAAYQLDGNRAKAKSSYEAFLKIQPTGQRADEVRSILANQF